MMGAQYVELGNETGTQTWVYYDNGGTIHSPDGEIVGTLNDDAVWQAVHEDPEAYETLIEELVFFQANLHYFRGGES